MPKIDQQLGQRVVDTFKVASDLLESANAEIETLRTKVASAEASDKAAKPIANAVIDKLAALIIDGEPLVLPGDVDAFRKQVSTKHGMAGLLSDIVDVLASRPAQSSKTAAELGSASDPRDPYAGSSSSRPAGFGGLPRAKSYF